MKGALLACALVTLSVGCSQTQRVNAGGPSCSNRTAAGAAWGSFVNRVRWQGRDFVASGPSDHSLDLGRRLGVVRCRVSDSLTPMPYEFRDGDAALLPAGTPLHEVQGYEQREAIGAEWGGRWWLFLAPPATAG